MHTFFRAQRGTKDMNQKLGFSCALAIATLFVSSTAMAQSNQSVLGDAAQIVRTDTAYPFLLVPTTNIWTQLLIDTATGRVWQVQFSLSDNAPAGKWVINDSILLPPRSNPKNGRFALYPTQNMYTFLLLDRQDSRIWQLQWSAEPENRGIIRSIAQLDDVQSNNSR
jgi:hypothetical protein